MFEDLQVLNKVLHSGFSVREIGNFQFAARETSAPLGLAEVHKAAREYPIVFPADGPLVPVAVLGSRLGVNRSVDEHGEWRSAYVPAHIRRFPFILGFTEENEPYKVMIETSVLEVGDQTRRLFLNNGEEGELLKTAKRFLVEYQRQISLAEDLCGELELAEVLKLCALEVSDGCGGGGLVKNVRIVDRERLSNLSDATIGRWMRVGLADVIVLHLMSVSELPRGL